MSALPQNLEAEQALLGALLFDNATLERIEGLRATHFYDPVHGRLFEQITALVRAGRVADGLTLKEWANADAGMIGIGGPVYLMRLMEAAAPLASQTQAYADMLIDMARRRAVIVAANEAIAAARAGDGDALGDLETRLSEIADGDAVAAGVSLADAGEEFLSSMDQPSLPTGLDALDARLGGLYPGELIVLGGRPSMGKTTIATQIARNVARAGGAVHFASLDMSRQQVACRAISAASYNRLSELERVQYFHLRNGTAVNRALLRDLARQLPRSVMIDDGAAQTVARIENGARATRRRFKRLDLIVVDYLQLVTASRRADGRVNEVSEVSQGLKAVAKRLNCPLLALCQLSRGVESRENKRPTLSDLRESGAIEQDADVVMMAYREAYYLGRDEPDGDAEYAAWKRKLDACAGELEIATLKQRQGPIGTDRFHADLPFDTIVNNRRRFVADGELP